MAMKPSLALRLGQQLRMTPQLQQAIKLLQLSTLDLQQEIQEALDSNLMLEELAGDDEHGDEPTSLDTPTEPKETSTESDQGSSDHSDTEQAGAEQTDTADQEFDVDAPERLDPELDGDYQPDTSDELASDKIPDELPVDSVWEDVWDDAPLPGSYSGGDDNDDDYIDTRNAVSVSLQSHLEEQLNLLHLSDVDEMIAMTIVDGLDKNGVLTIPIEDVLLSIPEVFECEMDEVLAVLHRIQHLDPIGVAARDLRECLIIQLKFLPAETPWRSQAIAVVSDYISSLANRDYALLIRKTRLKEDELRQVITLIQSLDPRPGADITPSNTEYVDPDVLVSKKNGRWTVELNPKSAPKIRVNPGYASMVKRADNSNDNTYLKNHLQEARWFIKSLQQRNDTLLKVSSKIVEYQRGFLEYGEQAMKPLVLHDIAKAVDLHESTISRVTTQKYMHTPAGVFELKYFFSSHVSTHAGGEVSSTAIRALIKKLVAEENPRKPLSDSKIANLLADQDINVARRTIAKYRESLMIPPSNERKQLV
ncbi:MAG: RNA polymerase sigma-54 factor [Candidatus Azotimanducaceae bacterium]|jgi:RNA polymerase sigma-54 factor